MHTQQILATMQGDLSLMQNGSINKNNLLAVPMLQGGKVQFS